MVSQTSGVLDAASPDASRKERALERTDFAGDLVVDALGRWVIDAAVVLVHFSVSPQVGNN